MLLEHQIIPYHTSSAIGDKIIILAPHPDDETLGCGGTILQLKEMNKAIKVIFLTSGDKADPNNPLNKIEHDKPHITDYSLMREQEAMEALSLLNVSDYIFLRYPDREIYHNFKQIYDELTNLIGQYMPDAIYVPSPIELNPDHRTSAEIALKLQMLDSRIKIVFYEVTTPFRPNILIDVSSYYDQKILAINKYKSQLGLIDYYRHISALNRFRGLTVSKSYCEAFWQLKVQTNRSQLCKWLCYETPIDDE